jgi:membrane protease YdiL (CAAX protease family)
VIPGSRTEATSPAPTGDAEWVLCWRCRKNVRRTEASCPFCLAPRRRRADTAKPISGSTNASTMARVMIFFGLMLGTSVLYGVLTSFGLEQAPRPRPTPEAHLRLMFGVEVVDTGLVVIALLLIGRPRRWARLATTSEAWLWVSAVAGVGIVVAVNAGYHLLLRSYLGVQAHRDALVAATGITPLVLVTYCVQPAVVEELFFRYLALDTLRDVMGVHAAVLVASIMFGLAHVGVPLSIPMLTLVGVVFGYARVVSGRLALPMLLHFLHNFIILAAG